MALKDPSYSVEELTRTKGEMEAFLADEEKLSQTRELLSAEGLSSDDSTTLKVLLRACELTPDI